MQSKSAPGCEPGGKCPVKPHCQNMILVCGIPQLCQWVCISNLKNEPSQRSSIPPFSHKQKGEGKDKAPTLLCCAVVGGN